MNRWAAVGTNCGIERQNRVMYSMFNRILPQHLWTESQTPSLLLWSFATHTKTNDKRSKTRGHKQRHHIKWKQQQKGTSKMRKLDRENSILPKMYVASRILYSIDTTECKIIYWHGTNIVQDNTQVPSDHIPICFIKLQLGMSRQTETYNNACHENALGRRSFPPAAQKEELSTREHEALWSMIFYNRYNKGDASQLRPYG